MEAADNDGVIRGTVTSADGPEAGVWVIAETDDLETVFRKIVVTGDDGRYVLPELPDAAFDVWVRGYGLVDSEPVAGRPDQELDLTAVVAPTPQEAAQGLPPPPTGCRSSTCPPRTSSRAPAPRATASTRRWAARPSGSTT